MAEYIEREKLLRDINHYHLSDGKFQHWVEVQQAADVAPVVHGRWIEKSAPAIKIYFECSHCGAQENKHTAIKGYYCWRCGAKMDDRSINGEGEMING